MSQQQQAQTDIQRKNDLLADLQRLRSQVDDGLSMGDAMFGRFAHVEVAREVNDRMEDLQKKKASLEQDLKEKEALIQRANQDFSDVKDTLPETLDKKRVQFVEDYTIAFLSLSYLFMMLSAIVWYVSLAEQKMAAVFKAIGYSALTTIVAGIILYLIA